MTEQFATLTEHEPQQEGETSAQPTVEVQTRRRNPLMQFLGLIWRARGLWLGLLALDCALYGQKLVTDQMRVFAKQQIPLTYSLVPGAMTLPIRWYALAILLALVAWTGSRVVGGVKDERRRTEDEGGRRTEDEGPMTEADNTEPSSLVPGPSSSVLRPRSFVLPRPRSFPALRYLLAFLALGLNLFGAYQLHLNRYDSALGGLCWLSSLLLLLGAFAGYRPAWAKGEGAEAKRDEVIGEVELPHSSDPTPRARKLEIALVIAIFALAVFLRFYRLDDWTTGIHGDEGEAGMDALNILKGNVVSPFGTGWFAQPNFYYWGIALCMKVFGTGLLGLRSFSALVGLAIFLPFYPLVRIWFGVRAALIASFLLAISDVTIHFSKVQFSNITVPLSLVLGIYFLFSGLRTNSTWKFVLSGYGFMLGLYFYNGGRLNPIFVVAVLGYLFLLVPVVRLPGVYSRVRKLSPGLGRLRAFRQAVWRQARGVFSYGGQILALIMACICFASPWAAYYLDNKPAMDSRTTEKMVFTNQENGAIVRYGITHAPLYIGLRMPRPDDVYPILPVVFEQTPFSVQILEDGFWPNVLWRQTTTTLSILTFRGDASSVYTFTGEPVAKPLESALIILGIALVLWRWRDARMGVLSLWFWSIIFAGGVLTTEAPYMARIIGIVPALAIFAAIVLDKLMSELISALNLKRANPQSSLSNLQSLYKRLALFTGGALLAAVLAYLAWQNISDYYGRYLDKWPFSRAVGQAAFVREMNNRAEAEGRTTPQYYSLGVNMGNDVIFWTHGVNRFLSDGVVGYDMANPSDDLPVLNNGDRDVIYMVYDPNIAILSAIKSYYPEGDEGVYTFGPQSSPDYYSPTPYKITYYRITREQIEKRRRVSAVYASGKGGSINGEVSSFGAPPSSQVQLPPASYPVQARWTGQLIAPAFAHYRFRLTGPVKGELTIDGLTVVTSVGDKATVDGEIILARGPHYVQMSGTLPDNTHNLGLLWSTVASPDFQPVESKYLWSGQGKGLAGEVRLLEDADPWSDPPPDMPEKVGNPPVIDRRIDGFLCFLGAADAISTEPFQVTWSGYLNVEEDGEYLFDIFSRGGSQLLLDNNVILENRLETDIGSMGSGVADLKVGVHPIVIRYNWSSGNSFLEAFWTPPGGKQELIGPENLAATDIGAWLPGSVSEPPPYKLLPPKPGQTDTK